MDSEKFKQFFLKPQIPRHRHYEILRARFIDEKSVPDIAGSFDIPVLTAQTIIRNFKRDFDTGNNLDFFNQPKTGPKNDRKKSIVREHILRLRARRYASTDIHKALSLAQYNVSLSLIDQVLREEGLTGFTKRSYEERNNIAAEIQSRQIPGLTIPVDPVADIPCVADASALDMNEERTICTPFAGIFLFVPFLIQAGIDSIVAKAAMVGTKMIPAVSYLLSLLTLKLVDKERKSHITDFSFDEGLGLFPGLNILPKATAITDYSYRLVEQQHTVLLKEWVHAIYPILCPEEASAFALDFHAIPYRGEQKTLENHYVPSKGKAQPAILTCFARSIDPPMLCYADADITHADKPDVILQFINYWKQITGIVPDWLYFDSKMTSYKSLQCLNTYTDKKIYFITIRRRGSALIKKLLAVPDSQWKNAVIDTPQRKHQKIKYLDRFVTLNDYQGKCRQIAVRGLGRATPTLFLTNNDEITGREVVLRYTRRNYIENDIGINVNFFHMDCLASEVRLNVSLDVITTVIANNCYRWLGTVLKGCEKMEPKQLFRKFVSTPGHIYFPPGKIVVKLDRRAHNPIIAQAKLDDQNIRIPWLDNRKLSFEFY